MTYSFLWWLVIMFPIEFKRHENCNVYQVYEYDKDRYEIITINRNIEWISYYHHKN